MEKLEILTWIKNNIPLHILKILFLGSNKKSKEQMGNKPGDIIYINKYWHLETRQIEFSYRIFVLDLLIFFLNHFMAARFTQWIHIAAAQKIGIILVEWVLIHELIFNVFRQNLIGYDKHNFRMMKNLTKQIVIIHLISMFIYFFDVLHKNLALTIVLMTIFWAVLILIMQKKKEKMIKKTIYKIVSSDNFGSGNHVNIEKDISLNFRNGSIIPINLVNEDIYFTDNDDLLLIDKNEMHNLYKKEIIKYLQIKDKKIVYKNNEWLLEN